MVKVQKPTPKSLSKLGPTKNSINKKKEIKKRSVSTEPTMPMDKNLKATFIAAMKKKQQILPPLKEKQLISEKKFKDKGYTDPSECVVKKGKKEKKVNIGKGIKHTPAVLAPRRSPTPEPESPEVKSKKASPNHKNKEKMAISVLGKPGQTDHISPKSQEKLNKIQKKKAAVKAYNKLQKQKKLHSKEKNLPADPAYTFKPLPFDEEQFQAIVCFENIKKIAEALRKQVEQELAQRKTSIFSDYKYCLDVQSFQIPNCPKRMVKLNVKHSLVDKEDDVIIIVPDLKRGAKVDYEPTIQHYEDLFREAGVEGLKVMPFNQLKNEYGSFESRLKLSNTYDYFLCDGRIVSHVVGFCGKIFQKPRTTFHAVRMDLNLKREIEKSMRRTAFKQLNKGNLISIPVGTHKFTPQQLAENIGLIVTQLETIYPGGLGNIRSLHLKIALKGTLSLPIYKSLAQPPLETPYVIGKREERMFKMKIDANLILSNFAITKNAKILTLNSSQIKNKLKIKEFKEALEAKREAERSDIHKDPENANINEQAPQDDDGEDSAVPAKKSRKEEKVEVDKKEPELEDFDDSEEDSDADDDENAEDDDSDADVDDDDDDDANEDVDDDDDAELDDDDDEDDEDGDDDEDQEEDDSE